MSVSVKGYPYAFHVALDGNGVNGLEGLAGVCLFLYNPYDDTYAYKIRYYDGIAGGHAVSVNPDATVGFLGNAGQHLVFYDTTTLDELDRVSTLRFETPNTSLQGSTHLVWLSEDEFFTAIGRNFYKFSLHNLPKPELLGPHGVMLPHAMQTTTSGRYIVYGSMDNPAFGRNGEARHVGVWDKEKGESTVIELPATCWHVIASKDSDLFYAVSFRVEPQDYEDYHDWAMAFKKEYVFEIDAADAKVVRHWSGGREIPAHINSDLTLSDTELIFCNGGSQTIVCIDLETFAKFRIIDEKPDLAAQLERPREVATQVYDALARGNVFTNSRHFLSALRVSRFSLLDSVYAAKLSKDQTLLFTANRGLNHITVYDYPAGTIRLRVDMPPIQEFQDFIPETGDPRLGFHHSVVLG